MATKHTGAWVEGPFKLIPIPSAESSTSDHASVYTASEMANAHNVLIRGLNAIVNQAPYVPTANEPGYNKKDVADLLSYVASWVKMVNHHHDTEETCIFPELEKFTGKPSLMDTALHQHEAFQQGMHRLLTYSSTTEPEKYTWSSEGGMKEIIDSFSHELISHLNDEIETFLSFKDLDSGGLRACWDRGEDYAKKTGNISMMYDVFPCVLGCADKTFKGSEEFPPLPWALPYMTKYFFAARNGAWRFNPCDFWGQPRPLAFGPQPNDQ